MSSARVTSRVEFREPKRKLVQVPPSTVHDGIVFCNGGVHKGGKGLKKRPKSNDLLCHHEDPSPKPTPIFSTSMGPTTCFQAIPASKANYKLANTSTTSLTPPMTVVPTGRKKVSNTVLDHGHVTSHRTNGPVERPMSPGGHPEGKGATHNAPKDHEIPGLNSQANKEYRMQESVRPGRKVMDGPPKFEPEVFSPKPYTPQLKRSTNTDFGKSSGNILCPKPMDSAAAQAVKNATKQQATNSDFLAWST